MFFPGYWIINKKEKRQFVFKDLSRTLNSSSLQDQKNKRLGKSGSPTTRCTFDNWLKTWSWVTSVLKCKLVTFMITLRQFFVGSHEPLRGLKRECHNTLSKTLMPSPSWWLGFRFCIRSSPFCWRVWGFCIYRFRFCVFWCSSQTSCIFSSWCGSLHRFGHPFSFGDGSWIFLSIWRWRENGYSSFRWLGFLWTINKRGLDSEHLSSVFWVETSILTIFFLYFWLKNR